jgi:hypothetical protein
MPRPKIRPVSPDEVKITRKGDTAVFTYADETLGGGMELKIGPQISKMTDAELLEEHNEVALSMEELRNQYEHVAIEIPVGKPQIEFSKRCQQWTMRGDVLRAYISDQVDKQTGFCEPIIEIDDQKLSWDEFGRMLTTYAGWGMRLTIVPDDETHLTPEVVIQNPEGEG